MELCLGTVQFGMDYGINGKKKPTDRACVEMLEYAALNGVHAIDTAAAYGNAEAVVGSFLSKKTISRRSLFLTTKLKPNTLDCVSPKDYAEVIRSNLVSSLRTLNTDYVDAYMFHSSRYAFEPEMIEAMYTVAKEGLARKIGVSVYQPDEARACLQNGWVSFIQAPYSVFDHRMKTEGVFETAQESNCQVHTRSAFLQGLAIMNEADVPNYLSRAKPLLRRMDEVCHETGISRVALVMAYIKKEKSITHLVFGVNSIEQLREDIKLFQEEVPLSVLALIEKEFADIDADIVIPSLWHRL